MSGLSPGALVRMLKALEAAKKAEMAKLAAITARAEHHRAESAQLRAQMAEAPREAPGSAFDLESHARWQHHLALRADAAEDSAAQADRAAAAGRAALATALGREQAVIRLLERARQDARRRAERSA